MIMYPKNHLMPENCYCIFKTRQPAILAGGVGFRACGVFRKLPTQALALSRFGTECVCFTGGSLCAQSKVSFFFFFVHGLKKTAVAIFGGCLREAAPVQEAALPLTALRWEEDTWSNPSPAALL